MILITLMEVRMAKTAKQRIDKAMQDYGIVEAKTDALLTRLVRSPVSLLVLVAYGLICGLIGAWLS